MEQFNPPEIIKFGIEWKRFTSSMGRSIYYHSRLEGVFGELEKARIENCFYLYIYNCISDLKNSTLTTFCSHIRRLKLDGAEVHYFIIANIIYISHFKFNDLEYIQNTEKNSTAGIYLAKSDYERSEFMISANTDKVMPSLNVIYCGDENIGELIFYLPILLVNTYGHYRHKEKRKFLLFYRPQFKNFDKSWLRIIDCMVAASVRFRRTEKLNEQKIVDKLATNIQFSLDRGTNWVIVGSGSRLFINALEKLKDIKRSNGEGLNLSNQSFVFYRPHCRDKTLKLAITAILGIGSPQSAYHLSSIEHEIFEGKIAGSACQEFSNRLYTIGCYVYSFKALFFFGFAIISTREYFKNEKAQRFIYEVAEQLGISGTTMIDYMVYAAVFVTAILLLPKRPNKKNPDFNTAKPFDINYSGSVLHLMAPYHSYIMIEKDEYERTHYCDIDKNENFVSAFDQEIDLRYKPKTDVLELNSFDLVWAYYKGLLWRYTTMILRFSIKVRKTSSLKNLFDPIDFEQAVMQTIDAKFGPYSRLGHSGRRFEVPLNWRYKNINGLDWLGYNIQELKYAKNRQTHWCTPLTNEHFLCFEFEEASNYNNLKTKQDIETLIENIISSCTIDFTTEVQHYRDQAQQQEKRSHYSTNIKPRYWIIYDDDPEQFISDPIRSCLQMQRRLMAYNLEQLQGKYTGISKPSIDEQFDIQGEQAEQLRKNLGLQLGQDPDHSV